MKKTTIFITLFFTIILFSGCSKNVTGVLQGNVNIGPLSPVVREGEKEPTPDPSVFTSRQIVVFSKNGKKEIIRTALNPDGSYSIELPVGEYLVDIDHSGIDFSKDVPLVVEIKSDQTYTLDIVIDTGIR